MLTTVVPEVGGGQRGLLADVDVDGRLGFVTDKGGVGTKLSAKAPEVVDGGAAKSATFDIINDTV